MHEQEPGVVEERTAQRLRELMRALVRALKAKKMYPANNPVLSRILSEFQDAVMGLLEEVEDFSLKVTPDELLYGEYSVYQNVSKRDGLAHRFLEARTREGLEQIVGSLHLERLDGVLVVRRREHQLKLLADRFEHAEAVGTGHLHIETDQIRTFLFDHPDRLDPLCAWPMTSMSFTLRKNACRRSRQLLVVDDEGANHVEAPVRCALRWYWHRRQSRRYLRPPGMSSAALRHRRSRAAVARPECGG
jgi:hypothetical protein